MRWDVVVIVVVLEIFEDNHSILDFLGKSRVFGSTRECTREQMSTIFFHMENKIKASNFNAGFIRLIDWLIQSHILKSENQTKSSHQKIL